MTGRDVQLSSRVGGPAVPALVADCGRACRLALIEFFAAKNRNPNTRAAYARAVSRFLAWCPATGLRLAGDRPVHIAAWIKRLGQEHSQPHAAFYRMPAGNAAGS